MENTDGQRKLTSLPEASEDSSQNEQQGATYGDDQERPSKETNSHESAQNASEPLRVRLDKAYVYKSCICVCTIVCTSIISYDQVAIFLSSTLSKHLGYNHNEYVKAS